MWPKTKNCRTKCTPVLHRLKGTKGEVWGLFNLSSIFYILKVKPTKLFDNIFGQDKFSIYFALFLADLSSKLNPLKYLRTLTERKMLVVVVVVFYSCFLGIETFLNTNSSWPTPLPHCSFFYKISFRDKFHIPLRVYLTYHINIHFNQRNIKHISWFSSF